jgi:hypothetical protein
VIFGWGLASREEMSCSHGIVQKMKLSEMEKCRAGSRGKELG